MVTASSGWFADSLRPSHSDDTASDGGAAQWPKTGALERMRLLRSAAVLQCIHCSRGSRGGQGRKSQCFLLPMPQPYLLGGPCLVKQRIWELKIRKSLLSTCCRWECWTSEQRRPPSCGPVDLAARTHMQIGFSAQHLYLGGRAGCRHSCVEALWPKVEGAGVLLHLCIWAVSSQGNH